MEPNEEQRTAFPRVKEFRFLRPQMEFDVSQYMDAFVELAEVQHGREIPLERVTIHRWDIPVGMLEESRRWVDTVDRCAELPSGRMSVEDSVYYSQRSGILAPWR
jgi:hypothetical protein